MVSMVRMIMHPVEGTSYVFLDWFIKGWNLSQSVYIIDVTICKYELNYFLAFLPLNDGVQFWRPQIL